ncbi:hypothetical protein [Bacillus toyonensis]|uniref:hypothetical protein n=1 Tax=Bacillus toyonensis TaxID=155322 RepID=UPI000BEF422C|nr:hypothetical protein [Bacillus toyonensis]PEL24326.1 hypothetical protein CN624_18225 [Bacillus toyonensis]
MTTKNEEYVNARRKGYTVTDNGMHDDKKLTLQAKGLLGIFLSNKEDWKINMKEIITRSKNGRDAHYKIVNELIANKYFARLELRKENRYYKMVYIFSDVKEDVAHKLSQLLPKYESEGLTYYVEYGEKTPITENQETGETKELPLPENQETENQLTENQYNNNTKSNILKNNNPKEEEEYIITAITESTIISLMNQKIEEREITNEKTIKAVHKVAAKCKAIGTTDMEAAENFVIMVVEEKMGKLGQKQQVKKPRKSNGNKKAVRTEMTPDWLGEETPQEEAPKVESNDSSQYVTMTIEELEDRLAFFESVKETMPQAKEQITLVNNALTFKRVTGKYYS